MFDRSCDSQHNIMSANCTKTTGLPEEENDMFSVAKYLYIYIYIYPCTVIFTSSLSHTQKHMHAHIILTHSYTLNVSLYDDTQKSFGSSSHILSETLKIANTHNFTPPTSIQHIHRHTIIDNDNYYYNSGLSIYFL